LWIDAQAAPDLDCVGIITTTLIAALLFNHIIICFIGTAAIMAVITHLLAKVGWFKTIGRTIVSGLILGVVSAVVSAPVSVEIIRRRHHRRPPLSSPPGSFTADSHSGPPRFSRA
jgi:hypothetical protein